ncbi:MAG: DUF2147 domain-containing protein [Methylotenera sp.]
MMVRILVAFIQIIAVLFMSMQFSFAANGTPAGLWKSIDDKTNKPRSLIRISEHNGEYSAVIEKGLLPTDTGDAICDKCKDERKNQPIIGMTIVKGMRQNGDKYDGGKILDPEEGKVYKCKMTLNEAGDELEVRGYIGISLLGRSQIWTRVE